MTFVIENHHYYAWCRDCPYTGPLRFKRDLAAKDAAEHVAAKHADVADILTDRDIAAVERAIKGTKS